VTARGTSGQDVVSLTFDDGPDPLATPALLKLLEASGVQATFFVSGRRAASNPELMRAIVEKGHAVGNHSHTHDPFWLFKGSKAISREIETAQSVLAAFGIRPLVFRPPSGVLGPGLRRPLWRAGLTAVTFSCRGVDFGNRRLDGLSGKILSKVGPGDIVMLHDILPGGRSDLDRWLGEVRRILEGIEDKGLSVVPLRAITGKPTMLLNIGAESIPR
jgi:peptidoglycan/xylan/chitin deacetylase (PgdA/CDA1 family)